MPLERPQGGAAPDSGGPSRAARIWRRTGVGLVLTAVVSALLAATWQPGGGVVVLTVGALAMVGCCAEVGGLGGFAGRGLRGPLLAAGVVLVAALSRDLLAGEPSLHLGWRYLEALAVALLVASLASGWRPALGWVVATGVAIAGATFHWIGPADVDPRTPVLAATVAALLLGLRHARRGGAWRWVVLVGALALWLVPPLPGLLHLWQLYGPAGLTALVVLSKVGDIFGYYVGNALGRTHPFPRTSPGKTTAGCVGSLLGTVAAGAGLAWAGLLPSGPLGVAGGLLAGLAVNLAAQAGDLLESRAKRAAGVKDSGTWFGPAGGLLDVFDSLLLSTPVAWLTWPWILGVP